MPQSHRLRNYPQKPKLLNCPHFILNLQNYPSNHNLTTAIGKLRLDTSSWGEFNGAGGQPHIWRRSWNLAQKAETSNGRSTARWLPQQWMVGNGSWRGGEQNQWCCPILMGSMAGKMDFGNDNSNLIQIKLILTQDLK